MQMSMS